MLSTFPPPIEHFPSLTDRDGLTHGFLCRFREIPVSHDREETLQSLKPSHDNALLASGIEPSSLATAEQVHGSQVAIIEGNVTSGAPVKGVDGLVTDDPEIALGIYVADCAAVYFYDPVSRCIGLSHSGKKGTEGNISKNTITLLQERYGAKPENLIIQISPCIRPPHYEVDIATMIQQQCRDAGVKAVHDCSHCTGSNLQKYYSYRIEKGKTGRMLAFLALA